MCSTKYYFHSVIRFFTLHFGLQRLKWNLSVIGTKDFSLWGLDQREATVWKIAYEVLYNYRKMNDDLCTLYFAHNILKNIPHPMAIIWILPFPETLWWLFNIVTIIVAGGKRIFSQAHWNRVIFNNRIKSHG